VQALREQHPRATWCWCPRTSTCAIKARALGLPAEDYFNDKTLDDFDLLYTGVLALPADFWDKHGKTMESWNQGGRTFYRIVGPLVPSLASTSSSTSRRPAPRRCMRASPRSPASRPC
jgi:PhoH-like ATPase